MFTRALQARQCAFKKYRSETQMFTVLSTRKHSATASLNLQPSSGLGVCQNESNNIRKIIRVRGKYSKYRTEGDPVLWFVETLQSFDG